MKIRKLRIRNFRSIKFIEVNFDLTKQLLVGQNNSGKSNLLRAIECVFNNRYIPNYNDIYSHKNSEELTVIDVMISSARKDKNFSEDWLSIFGDDIKKNEYGEESYSIRCVIKVNEKNGRIEINRFPMTNWDSAEYSQREKTVHRNIRRCIPSYFITSERDITDEVRIRSSNFSQLLRNSNITLNSDDKNEIEEKLSEINVLITNKIPDLSDIENKLSEISTSLNHVQSVSILPIPNKLTDIEKGVEILVEEDDKRLPVEMYGDGTRSWISILSLKSFVELQKYQNELEGLPFFPILLIEEPESHLHPHAQQKIIKQLSGIEAEMFVTTHSCDIVSSVADFQYSRLYKEEKETKLAIINGGVDSVLDYKIKSQIIPYKTALFFSDYVILVEGISDKIVIENYFFYKKKKRLVDIGVSVIDVGGFGNLGLFRKFCNYYKIDNIILADLDAKEQIESSIAKYKLSKGKIFYTRGKELENDLLFSNFDAIKEMFVKEASLPEQQIQHLSETNELDKKLEFYLKSSKTEYPYVIKKYFKENFDVPIINDVIDELEEKL